MIKVGDYKTTPKDEQEVLKVLRSGRLSEGTKVREFEERWANFIGTKYCVLTNSGTSALIACLEILKYQNISNKKVLTSPLTFIATVNAIVLTGYEPIFSDVNRETFVIEPTNHNVDIFLPVHLYGYPVNMNEFFYKYTIEDAAEAHGSIYKSKKVGSIGDMGVFSFYIAHNIQVGDMGAITTNNREFYEELKRIKAHGRLCLCPVCRRNEGLCPHKNKSYDPRFTHIRIAYNFKTTEIQATLGLNQLEQANEIIKKRQENVKYLNEGLKDLREFLQLPIYDKKVSYLAYPIVIKKLLNRNIFCKELEKSDIETRPFFSCVPLQQPAYEYLKKEWEEKLPNAEWLGNNGLHIGIHQYLTRNELDYIIETFHKVIDTAIAKEI